MRLILGAIARLLALCVFGPVLVLFVLAHSAGALAEWCSQDEIGAGSALPNEKGHSTGA